MIAAQEALRLSSAQLTEDEKAAADRLDADIDEQIRTKMEFRGVDFVSKETNPNVIAEVNQRLKAAGYIPQWQLLVEQHRLNAAKHEIVGCKVAIAPSDEAFRSLLA